MATVSTRAAVVGWHELVAADVVAEQLFYADLFDWAVRPWRPGTGYPVIRAEGRNHGGFARLEGRTPAWFPYVTVDDVDGLEAAARAAGGRAVAGPEEIEGVGRCVVLADPQEALFAAIAPIEEAPPRSVFVWDELATSEVEAARRFYAGLFGWALAPRLDGYDVFRSGGRDVGGLLALPPEMPEPTWTPYVRVDDVDAALRRARWLGATLVAGPLELGGFGRWAVLLDPGGAAFGVHRSAT